MKKNDKDTFRFQVAGRDLKFTERATDDPVITGRQVAATLNGVDADDVIVMRWPEGAPLVEVAPDDTVDLRDADEERFVAVVSDRSFRLDIQGKRYEWPLPFITAATLAALATIDLEGVDLVFERENEPDRILDDEEHVSLTGEGIEKFRVEQSAGKISVKVYTTSGVYPKSGTKKARPAELVSKVLDKAKQALELTDVTNWIATVGDREIQPGLTFQANQLAGEVEIHWGPREGGGGAF